MVESALRRAPGIRAALARTLHGLGVLLERQGRYPDAEQSLRRALELQRAALGPVHPDMARTLQDLAKVIDESGKPHRCHPVMRQALAMQRQLNGSQPDPGLAETINDLGVLLYESGAL